MDARPSWIKIGEQEMFGLFDVNGDAIDASVSDNDIPV